MMTIEKKIECILFFVCFILINIPFIKAMISKVGGILFVISITICLLYYYHKKQYTYMFLLKILGCTLLLNAAFLVGWLQTPWPVPQLYHREFCLKYISEGSLYGGQPYCAQGPIAYILAKIIDFFPGSNDITFQIGSFFILSAIFVLLYFIKKKKTNDTSFFFLVIIFILYFIRIAEDEFASIVAVIFLLLGIYILFVSSLQYKEIYGGFVLALALFSKAQFLVPVVSILFFYAFSFAYKKEELSLTSYKEYLQSEKIKAFFKSALLILIPIILLFVILKLIFPNFLSYYYLAQFQQQNKFTLGEALVAIVTLKYSQNGLFFIFYIMLFIAIGRIVHRKALDLFSFMCSVALFIVFIKMVQVYGVKNITESYRYFFAFMPFFVVNLYSLKQEISLFSKGKKIIVFIGLIILFLGLYRGLGGINVDDLLDGSVFNEERLIKKMQREVMYPLFEIPPIDSGKVLVSQDYVSLFGDKGRNPFIYLKEEDFENIEIDDPYAAMRPDMGYAPILEKLGIVKNLTEYNPPLIVNLTQTEATLLNKTYSVIIKWVYQDNLSSLMWEHKEKLITQYCDVSIGALPIGYSSEGNFRFIVFLMDAKNCEYLKAKIYAYYNEAYTQLCERGEYTAIIAEQVLNKNNLPLIGKHCNTWKRTTDFMVAAHFKALYFSFFIFCYLCFIFCCSVFYHADEKKWQFQPITQKIPKVQ